jgi:hypothetical protein
MRAATLLASHNAGEAADYNTDAGYKAVQESRDALAGLQDKQTELLEAQRDLQSRAVDKLTSIEGKVDGTFVNVVGWFY